MKYSVSMLELSEIREIIEFDDAIEELNAEDDISNINLIKENGSPFLHTTGLNGKIDFTTNKKSNSTGNIISRFNNENNSGNIKEKEHEKVNLTELPDDLNSIIFGMEGESDEERVKSLRYSKDDNMQDESLSRRRRSASFSHVDILKKKVGFSNVEVREYNVTLGDHPDCVYGPPLTLGWKYVDLGKKNLDQYESSRAPRKRRESLCMSLSARKQLLLNAGYLKYELREAAREVKKVQRDRKFSIKSYPLFDAGFAIQSAAKSMRKSLIFHHSE